MAVNLHFVVAGGESLCTIYVLNLGYNVEYLNID